MEIFGYFILFMMAVLFLGLVAEKVSNKAQGRTPKLQGPSILFWGTAVGFLMIGFVPLAILFFFLGIVDLVLAVVIFGR